MRSRCVIESKLHIERTGFIYPAGEAQRRVSEPKRRQDTYFSPELVDHEEALVQGRSSGRTGKGNKDDREQLSCFKVRRVDRHDKETFLLFGIGGVNAIAAFEEPLFRKFPLPNPQVKTKTLFFFCQRSASG